MFKILFFLITFVYAQNLNPPTSPMVLTDVLLTKNFTQSNLSSGGGSIGGFGGGDTTDRRRLAAWYYGDRQIQVCKQVNKYFSLSETEVVSFVQDAILVWKNYFDHKGINKKRIDKVNLNFNLKPTCEGGEDLVLYFGTGPINQNLLDLRAFQSLSNPVAYVNKTYMSEDLKWSKGYIRFVEDFSYGLDDGYFPNWSDKDQFYQILLHEIGHVLGFAHIPGTIMTGSIVRETIVENKILNTVDLDQELYPCPSCLTSYSLVTTKDHVLFPEGTLIHFLNDIVRIERGLSKGLSTLDIQPTSIIKKDLVSSLISIFEPEEQMIQINHLYFLNYQSEDLVFVQDGADLKVLRKGEQIAQFLKGVM